MPRLPCLVLDLDLTLIHTDDAYYTTLRPYALWFLQRMSAFYRISICTMGTREYAREKCDELGITPYVRDKGGSQVRIVAREDAPVGPDGKHMKCLHSFLCSPCRAHSIAVDDMPGFWYGGDGAPLPVVPWEAVEQLRIARPCSVVQIPPFADPRAPDTCLLQLAWFLEQNRHILAAAYAR